MTLKSRLKTVIHGWCLILEHQPLFSPAPLFSMQNLQTGLVLAPLLALQACASYGQHANTLREGLLTGQPELSLSIAEQDDLQQKDIITSLDKGMLRRINHDFAGSNQIFEVAKKQIEALYGISITENLSSVTINDTLRGYEGDRYEQLLLHAFMAMNYIQLGQIDGARVEMLQANVKMMEWGDEPDEDAFLRYLEGIIYESLGEYDNALISYRKAYTVYKEKAGVLYPAIPMVLKKDLLRLLTWQGMSSEYKTYAKEFNLTDYKPAKPDNDHGELIVILNNGLAPVRSEAAIPIYSSQIQQNLRVAFPVYRENKKLLDTPQVEVNGKKYGLETAEDVDALARHSLEEAMPEIMARATARAVVKYNTQHSANENSALAGLLMTVTNMVTERADTRSWTTLPQEIQVQRIVLPVGEYPLKIQMLNVAGQVVDEIDKKVVIKAKQSAFVIDHWISPVQKKTEQSSEKIVVKK
jgi:hypothetical protein